MGIVLDVLIVLAIIAGTIAVLFALALVMPVRVGLSARGDSRLDGGAGNVRIFGGIVGAGIRADRGSRDDPRSMRLVFGVMVWRSFIPIRTREMTVSEDDEPGDTGQGVPDDTEPWAAPPPPPGSRKPSAPDQPSGRSWSEPQQSGPERYESTEKVDESEPIPPGRDEHRPDVSESKPDTSNTIQSIQSLLRKWWPAVRGVASRLRGIIRVRRFHVRGAIGLGDPMLTGQTVGLVYATRGLSNPTGILAKIGIDRGAYRVDVVPVFDEITVRGSVDAEWRISMRRIWLAALFAGWFVARTWWRSRRPNATSNTSTEQSGGTRPSKI